MDIQDLQDSLKISMEQFEPSRLEAQEAIDMYHNRQHTEANLAILADRGQPAETFNVVKLFSRLLLGYYSTVVNTVKVEPQQEQDALIAGMLNDLVDFTFRDNYLETEGDKIKLDGLLTGLMCVHENVVDTGKRDKFNRPIRRIRLSHVPAREVALDHMSRKEDGSDARFVHRFKWVHEDYLKKLIRKMNKNADNIISKLSAYENHLNQQDSEFDVMYDNRFVGYYKQDDCYLLVHSITVDEKDRVWSTHWCADEIISQKEVTYRDVRFPYRTQRIQESDQSEYYGLFREVIETQKAINQALIKIQLMVNTQKIFIQENAVSDIEEFKKAVNNVHAIIEVLNIDLIKIENLSREVLDQYSIIDKGFDRIKQMLGVNDSFLGAAFASDSGRKVKLQQNQTILSLRHITARFEQFYRLMATDVVGLIKQFYTADEAVRIADDQHGSRYIKINQPMQIWSGEFDANQNPIMETPFEQVLDVESGKPLVVDGQLAYAPMPQKGTELAFTDVDINIDTTAYNDEDEKNQLMLETAINGGIGQAMLQFDPAAYFEVAGLSLGSLHTKHTPRIKEIMLQLSQNLAQKPLEEAQLIAAGMQSSGVGQQTRDPLSKEDKLPQNTNEGVG